MVQRTQIRQTYVLIQFWIIQQQVIFSNYAPHHGKPSKQISPELEPMDDINDNIPILIDIHEEVLFLDYASPPLV